MAAGTATQRRGYNALIRSIELLANRRFDRRGDADCFNGHNDGGHFRCSTGRDQNWRTLATHWPTGKETERQPDHAEKDRGEHVGQIMRTERDPTEADQQNKERSGRQREHAPAPALDSGYDEESELSVKQGRANSMTTGETVAGPIDKPAIHKWTMSMDENFDPLIEQHATWHGHNQSYQGWPPPFKNEKQNEAK